MFVVEFWGGRSMKLRESWVPGIDAVQGYADHTEH